MNEIIGKKIILRPISAEDTKDILKWRNCDLVRSNFIYQPLLTEEEHQKWLRTKVSTGEVVQFIMLEKHLLSPMGSTYLRDIDNVAKKAEYGIFIGEEEALNKGYGTEAAKLMLQYAFDVLKLHKVSLRVLQGNERAIHSYEHAGFVREGHMVDEVFINGEYKDVIFMAAINKEENQSE